MEMQRLFIGMKKLQSKNFNIYINYYREKEETKKQKPETKPKPVKKRSTKPNFATKPKLKINSSKNQNEKHSNSKNQSQKSPVVPEDKKSEVMSNPKSPSLAEDNKDEQQSPEIKEDEYDYDFD